MCVFLASFQGSEVKHLKGRACVIILGGPMRISLSAVRFAEEKTKIVGESKRFLGPVTKVKKRKAQKSAQNSEMATGA